MVHQDLAHQLCGHCEKVSAILPLRQILFDHSDISFVYQGRALECVSGPFVAEIVLGDPPEFVVNERNKRVQGGAISAPPTSQQLGNLSGRIRLH